MLSDELTLLPEVPDHSIRKGNPDKLLVSLSSETRFRDWRGQSSQNSQGAVVDRRQLHRLRKTELHRHANGSP